MEHAFEIGDYVYYQYSKNQEYPGIVRALKDGLYIVDINTNKKKNEESEMDRVEATHSKLRPMNQ